MTGYRLFEAFGLELEYMIVNRDTLAVLPAADQVFMRETGWPCSSFEDGRISWSNEMTLHVIELKTTHPERELAPLAGLFSESAGKINSLLKTDNGRLLSTAAHPLMDPAREARLWPHDDTGVYTLYDRIFDCGGHGWSNLQSTHINLPFSGDREFGILHGAIRFLLPLIPALTAASPVIEGIPTEYLDTRMVYYMKNQKRIPAITGHTIPEPVYTEKQYERSIYRKMERAVKPHDPEGILSKHFLNSRGAIARFDRSSIEIRVIDNQESPLADIACAALIIELLKDLCRDERGVLGQMARFPTLRLKAILERCIRDGEKALITDRPFMALWGLGPLPRTAGELWRILAEPLLPRLPDELRQAARILLDRGTLSTVLLRDLGENPSRQRIIEVWNKAARCLSENRLYQ